MFIGKLSFERVKDKESFFGRSVFRLTEDFAYEKVINKIRIKIMCDKGFETDFASIPEWIFFLRPRNGKWIKASVIHDKACILASQGIIKYKTADVIFYHAMLDDEASWFTANFIYYVVRLNHILTSFKKE